MIDAEFQTELTKLYNSISQSEPGTNKNKLSEQINNLKKHKLYKSNSNIINLAETAVTKNDKKSLKDFQKLFKKKYDEDTHDPNFKLARPDTVKTKKVYDYKVEGKIESGIKDLDTFLSLIQPMINILFIQVWKGIYGIADLSQSAGEKFTTWKERREDIKRSWKTLQAMGVIPYDRKLSFKGGNNAAEDLVGSYFQDHMKNKMNNILLNDLIKKKETNINEELKKEKNEKISEYEEKINEHLKGTPSNQKKKLKNDLMQKYIKQLDKRLEKKKQDELWKYMDSPYIKEGQYKRNKLFDMGVDNWDTDRQAINSSLQELIKTSCRDETGKISDEGKELMKGYVNIIDSFNKKDKDTMKTHWGLDIPYILAEANGRTFRSKKIEDEDYNYIKGYNDNKFQENETSKIFTDAIGALQPKTK